MNETPVNDALLPVGVESVPATVPEALLLSPGATLAAARQAQGLTVEQVASQLNLAPRQIVALENGNYAALPGMVIARGFLRTYAKLLKIDSAPLLSGLADDSTAASAAPMRHALSATFSETRLPSLTTPATSNRSTLIGGLVLLVLAAGAASYALGLWPQALLHKLEQVKRTAEPPGGVRSADVAGSALTTTETLSVQKAVPAAPLLSGATAQNPLVLNVQQDSWIEIRRADNSQMVSKLIRAGSVETFDVSEPVTLTVGNLAGVEASLRGTRLELASTATGNVARVRLK